MTKYILTIILPLLSFTVNGQEINQKIGDDICNCLEIKSKGNSITQKTITNCFSNSLENYQAKLSNRIDLNSTISVEDQAYNAGQEIYEEIQPILVKNCDIFYDFFSNLREESYKSMKLSANKSQIDSLSLLIDNNPTTSLIWQRGIKHFALNDFDNAKKDFLKCTSIDSNYIQANFLLGWLYERAKNYDKAIELYELVFVSSKKKEITIFIELAKRKRDEQK